MPLRKVAQPEDVAAQVVVLASDALSGHVSGQLVMVAGGMEGRVLHDDLTPDHEKGGESLAAPSRVPGPQEDLPSVPDPEHSGIGSGTETLSGVVREVKRGPPPGSPLPCRPQEGNPIAHPRGRRTVALDEMTGVWAPCAA